VQSLSPEPETLSVLVETLKLLLVMQIVVVMTREHRKIKRIQAGTCLNSLIMTLHGITDYECL
jgi:hypothetical protein